MPVRSSRPKVATGDKPSDAPRARRQSRRVLKSDLARQCEPLWPRRLVRGQLTLMCGAGQVGVTSVALELAACVTTGAPWPDENDDAPWRAPGKVLLLCDEPTRKTIRRRIEAVGAESALVRDERLAQAIDTSVDPRGLQRALAAGGVSLVVLDALRLELWRDGVLSCASEDALASLARLAERYGVAILACVRLAQPFQGSLPKRVIGAIGACNAAMAAFTVVRHDALPGRRVLHAIRGHYGTPPLVFRLHALAGGEGLGIEWQVDRADRDEAEPNGAEASQAETALGKACRWLQWFLRDGPVYTVTLDEQARENGHASATMRRARAKLRLGRKRVLEQGTLRTYWELPAETWRGRPRSAARSVVPDGPAQSDIHLLTPPATCSTTCSSQKYGSQREPTQAGETLCERQA